MRILLDTNALLWLLSDDERLSQLARHSIEKAQEIMVSEISLWEITIKINIGKLSPIPELLDTVKDLGFRRLNMNDDNLRAYESLPLVHRDPFDRMLVAQTMTEKAALVTSDGYLEEYGIKVIKT